MSGVELTAAEGQLLDVICHRGETIPDDPHHPTAQAFGRLAGLGLVEQSSEHEGIRAVPTQTGRLVVRLGRGK